MSFRASKSIFGGLVTASRRGGSAPMKARMQFKFNILRCYRISAYHGFGAESDPYAGLTPIDIEKELFKIKRKMGSDYSKGHYKNALESAVDLEDKVAQYIGRDSAIYASCLNNVALMNKMMGNSDIAMTKYTEALHAYDDVVGKKHPSYISTLANIGVLYKSLAQSSKGLEKVQLLERAEEALTDALRLRTEVSGPDSKETLYSANHLAMMLFLKDLPAQAELRLRETVDRSRKTHGDKYVSNDISHLQNDISHHHKLEMTSPNYVVRPLVENSDSLTATTLNNLGLVLKNQKKFGEAEKCYKEALHIRSSSLGDKHPETIVSMHNLAELYTEQGKQQESNDLREQIITILGPPADEATATATATGEEANTVANNNSNTNANDNDPSLAATTADEDSSSPTILKEALSRATASVASSAHPAGNSTDGLTLRKSAKEAVSDAVKETAASSGFKPSTRSRRKN